MSRRARICYVVGKALRFSLLLGAFVALVGRTTGVTELLCCSGAVVVMVMTVVYYSLNLKFEWQSVEEKRNALGNRAGPCAGNELYGVSVSPLVENPRSLGNVRFCALWQEYSTLHNRMFYPRRMCIFPYLLPSLFKWTWNLHNYLQLAVCMFFRIAFTDKVVRM